MTQPPPKVGPRRDEGLLPDGLTSQDKKFFQGTSPHVYFETRLRTLAASLGETEHAEAIGAGLRMGDFVIPEASEPLVTDQYAAVEVTNLFHHVGETVWRTFLCLRDDSSIRLALARLTTQRVRASLREALASSPEALAQRLRVVLGLDDVSQVASERVAATERLLRTAAYRLLDDAPLNNVTKHGFALSADNSAIGFVENEDGSGPRLSRTGLWLRYVQPVQRDDRECWTETYSAVDVPQTMALTWMLIQLLGTLWRVGRVRVELDQELPMALPSADQMRHLLDEPRMDIRRVRFDLPYLERDLIITMEVDVVSAHPLGPPAEADVE